MIAKAKIDFSKALIDNRKKSANDLQRVFRGHLARNEYHELDKRRVQPRNPDIENELSRIIQPKQKLKSSEL